MSNLDSEKTLHEGWHNAWEETVYSQGLQLNRYPFDAVVKFLFSRVPKGLDRATLNVLEIGCGAGNNLWFAAREGFRVAGIDGSHSAITFARERFAQDHLQGDFKVGSFSSLPWEDASFDVVIDRKALTHTTTPVIEKTLDEVMRVLKPGGRFFSEVYSDEHPGRAFGQLVDANTFSQFTGGYFNGLGTTHFFPREEIDALYKSRFTLTSVIHRKDVDALEAPQAVNAFWFIECLRV